MHNIFQQFEDAKGILRNCQSNNLWKYFIAFLY